jgi:hypothetical protein
MFATKDTKKATIEIRMLREGIVINTALDLLCALCALCGE